MNRVNVQHSERVTQVMIQRHIGRRERGKVRGDHAQVLKNQLIALEHRGLVRGELLEVLHHVVDVEVPDHALLVDEAANHLRRHLLVDLLTALEHQRLVARVQSEQHAGQHLQQLHALRRQRGVLLHLEQHDLHCLRLTPRPTTHSLVLVLALEQTQQREGEHQSRLLRQRALDVLHQTLLHRAHVAPVRPQQKVVQRARRLQADPQEHQRLAVSPTRQTYRVDERERGDRRGGGLRLLSQDGGAHRLQVAQHGFKRATTREGGNGLGFVRVLTVGTKNDGLVGWITWRKSRGF